MNITLASVPWRMRVTGSASGLMAAACARRNCRRMRAHQLGEQALLGGEVPVHQALRDPGCGADVGDACVRVPLRREQRRSGLEQLGLAFETLFGVRSTRLGHAVQWSTRLTVRSRRGNRTAREVQNASIGCCLHFGRMGATRDERIEQRTRNPKWKNAPVRIEMLECINCDACLRHCPTQFGAIFNHGPDVVIIPELCSGCDKCLPACPVNCIYPFPELAGRGCPGRVVGRAAQRQRSVRLTGRPVRPHDLGRFDRAYCVTCLPR